ncbi:hypothetical protein ACFOLL_15085 [Falsochrobactrum ovis]|uniref:Response regulatory domain-containing protein n=1 Tax=Falsochrobactrum ovis TaxID=1293442 RepID=A0A364JX33_9HYPH|nr:hypothetical protein [Falsochrobactrum ovis]RAK31192.1 hypothetical protein C7374_103333 [Falsochrobactrum ovis]
MAPLDEDPNALNYFRRRKRMKSAASRLSSYLRPSNGSQSIKIHRNGSGLFAGQHLLFFCNKSLLTAELSKKLTQKGATLIGPIDKPAQAIRIIDTRIVDAVILDSSLRLDEIIAIVELLYQIPIPFIFVRSPMEREPASNICAYILDESDVNLSIIAEALFSHETKANEQ